MSSSRKYILLRDVLTSDRIIPVGSIFEKISENDTYRVLIDDTYVGGYEPNLIENNPDWFEEVKEEKTAEEIARDVITKTLYYLPTNRPDIIKAGHILENLKKADCRIVKDEPIEIAAKKLFDKQQEVAAKNINRLNVHEKWEDNPDTIKEEYMEMAKLFFNENDVTHGECNET